jgi:hypothetical protein
LRISIVFSHSRGNDFDCVETYIYEGNVQKGPFELQQIHTLAASGLISKEALYWQPGMDGWKPLAAL